MKRTEPHSGPERRRAPRDPALERLLHPTFRLLRWIGGQVRGFHAALGLYLGIGLGVLLAAVLLFAGLAALMRRGLTRRVDEAVLLWLDARASPALDVAALEITALGGTAAVWMILLVASAFLWVSRHHYSVLLLWAAYAGGSLINFVLKALFDRPRPELFPWRTYAGHSSFPSGHSMTAVVVFATLAYLVARLEPTRLMRRLTLVVAALVILLIGLSRMYLGVHYPSDVLGGFIVGLAWATFCALGIEAVRYFRSRRPEVAEEERDLERGVRPLSDA